MIKIGTFDKNRDPHCQKGPYRDPKYLNRDPLGSSGVLVTETMTRGEIFNY